MGGSSLIKVLMQCIVSKVTRNLLE